MFGLSKPSRLLVLYLATSWVLCAGGSLIAELSVYCYFCCRIGVRGVQRHMARQLLLWVVRGDRAAPQIEVRPP